MSNKLQVGSARAFYENTATSKLTLSVNGIVASGSEPVLEVDINGGAKALTATVNGIQVIDGGSNSLITYTTNAPIKSVDRIKLSNTTNEPLFYDLPVANNVKPDTSPNGHYDNDVWEYYIEVGQDVAGSPLGYIANTVGEVVRKFVGVPVSRFTVGEADGTLVLEAGFDGNQQLFGKAATVGIQGIPRAGVPLKLLWSEANKNYSLADGQLGYIGDEFLELIGATVGLSIQAHH